MPDASSAMQAARAKKRGLRTVIVLLLYRVLSANYFRQNKGDNEWSDLYMQASTMQCILSPHVEHMKLLL